MRFLVFFMLSSLFLLACNKEAGRGGTSSITGKVYVYNILGSGDTVDEYFGMDEDVYITYGDADNTYDDKFSCSYDGSYRFDYLTPGTYKIFAYSRCDTCADGQKPVFKTVEITDKKTAYPVSNLNILK